MKKMKFSVLFIIAGLLLFSSCEDSGSSADDGKLTVEMDGYNSVTGDNVLYIYVYDSGEADLNTPANVHAFNSGDISGGSASIILETAVVGGDFVNASGTQWTGEGGESYDVYIYTDDVGNDPDVSGSSPQKTKTFPVEIEIDGDKLISLNYVDDMEAY